MSAIEPAIQADIECWLRDPGDILDELDGSAERGAHQAVVEAESVTLRRGLAVLRDARSRAAHLAVQGALSSDDLAPEIARIEAERAELERRPSGIERA